MCWPWPSRRTEHRVDGVFVAEPAVQATTRAARAVGLGLIAQVHSHPGQDTRHSDGDDYLILMPYEDMFSLVVPDYGPTTVTVHGVYRDGSERTVTATWTLMPCHH